ncbi:hypothetical protein [Thiobacter aerophilum]|uniref:Uncharacterized protein n=1 Tax=Thiobacter aerophilum TaxID=3121275 RepID=A0ABV0EI51_9BURK
MSRAASLCKRLSRFFRPTPANAGAAQAQQAAADSPPAEEPSPPAQALPDGRPPADSPPQASVRPASLLYAKALWLVLGGIILAGAGALASALVLESRHTQALLNKLEARQAALERENQALRDLPRIIAAPQLAPGPLSAQATSGHAVPDPKVPARSAPTQATPPAAASRPPVTGECLLASDDDVHTVVRECIDRFNRAAARGLPPPSR